MADSATRSRKRSEKKDDAATKTPLTVYQVIKSDEGYGWREYSKASGRNGREAAKVAAARAGDQYDPGRYKAVPVSTWEAPANQLEIELDTEPRFSFKAPRSTNGASAE